MLWPRRGSMNAGGVGERKGPSKDLGTLDGSRGGLILTRRVKAATPPRTYSSYRTISLGNGRTDPRPRWLVSEDGV